MSVDWKWIYQRPHILAEKLAQDYDVTVVFPRNIIAADFKVPRKENINFSILWHLPLQEKNEIIYKLSRWVNHKTIESINDSYDYIYVGYPLYARYIPESYRGCVIYDCMDNYEAIYADRKRVYRITEQERPLVKRCDLLLASSEVLCRKMNKIANQDKSILVRNGTDIKAVEKVCEPQVKSDYSIGYIGTISRWFDYELIKESIRRINNITYHLIGPNQAAEQPDVVYHGAVPHDRLGETVKDIDCLIMPFVVNEIVRAVDPVKLYEYIAFGKCIVSVYYPELERFRDFVYFYESCEEYIELLEDMIKKGFPPKYDSSRQKKFLEENSWDLRYKVIRDKMKATEINLC